VRVGLALLAVNQGVPGLWAAVAPRSFYDDFPLPSHPWVSAFPPYNEHLTRDLGMMSVSTAVVLAAAGVFLEPRLVTIAVVAVLTFMVPHTLWHIGRLARFPAGDAVAQVVVNLVPIGVGLACVPWRWTRALRTRLRRSRPAA
jgi:hypothetical protein